jgi:hypothetical protein
MPGILEGLEKTVGKFCDNAYSKNWMLYAVIILIALIVIIIYKG